jgi:hypothetical protein
MHTHTCIPCVHTYLHITHAHARAMSVSRMATSPSRSSLSGLLSRVSRCIRSLLCVCLFVCLFTCVCVSSGSVCADSSGWPVGRQRHRKGAHQGIPRHHPAPLRFRFRFTSVPKPPHCTTAQQTLHELKHTRTHVHSTHTFERQG